MSLTNVLRVCASVHMPNEREQRYMLLFISLTNVLQMCFFYIVNEHVQGCTLLFLSVMRCLEVHIFVYTAKKCSVI
jgi:hypothetical protein